MAINIAGGNMEISNKNRFVEFLKKYGIYAVVGIVVFAIALTFTLASTLSKTTSPTSVETITFSMPMTDAVVLKDYSDTSLQKNDTLNQWEAHLGVDMTSTSNDVYSVLAGQVMKVEYDFLKGNTITIQHANGFVSCYSSLASDNLLEEGAKVMAGEKIGEISESATAEIDLGSHLHFTLMLNGNLVDPNDYLDLQQK